MQSTPHGLNGGDGAHHRRQLAAAPGTLVLALEPWHLGRHCSIDCSDHLSVDPAHPSLMLLSACPQLNCAGAVLGPRPHAAVCLPATELCRCCVGPPARAAGSTTTEPAMDG